MHRPRPFYCTFEASLYMLVAAESYAYSYVAILAHALLHVAKIIQQAWLHRKRVNVKIKQKNLETIGRLIACWALFVSRLNVKALMSC